MAGEPTKVPSDGDAAQRLHALTQAFTSLLDGYGKFMGATRLDRSPQVTRFRNLLDCFKSLAERVESAGSQRSIQDKDGFHALLTAYDRALEAYRHKQQDRADDFNILAVMQLTRKEIRHSMVLAWLLDHDMRRLGTHAQGSLGFLLLLNELGLPMDYAECRYWVRREVAGDESIVDIEIASRGQFLIHIENKIWSSEGSDQTYREWADLRRRATAIDIDPDHPNAPVHALFLTPHGENPDNPKFRAVAWGRVVRVLEAFAGQAKPPDVKLFASHYARALRRFIVLQDQT